MRSLNSSVLRWPNRKTVVEAFHRWTDKIRKTLSDVRQIGYFGSYARGDWGVGSNLDVTIVVKSSNQPFERRGAKWNTSELPVPVDLRVYTLEEWDSLAKKKAFPHSLAEEIVWVFKA